MTINAGTLLLANAGALNASGTNTVAFGSGSIGTLSLNGNNATISNLITSATPGSPVVQNASATAATLTIVNPSNNTFAGVLQDGPGGGALSIIKDGAGTLTLSGNNTFSGGMYIKSGTLTLGGNNTLTGGVRIYAGELKLANTGALNASGANGVNFLAPPGGTTGTLTLNGNSVTISSLSGGPQSQGPGASVVQNANATPATLTVNDSDFDVFSGVLSDGVGGGPLSLIKNGSGTLFLKPYQFLSHSTFSGGVTMNAGFLGLYDAPTFNSSSTLLINGGTLRLNFASGTSTIGSGVTASIHGSGLLELAGFASNLSFGANRVNILNISLGAPGSAGVLVSGTNQIVGGIDGSGNTQVNSGNDLTANHIVQNALVIGGTVGSPALVTIGASDASGSPLGSELGTGDSGLGIGSSVAGSGVGPMALDSSLINPQAGAASLSAAIDLTDGDLTGSATSGEIAGGSGSAVPEPSASILLGLACLFIALAVWRRRVAARLVFG